MIYRTPAGEAESELRVQGSRFFAFVARAPTVEAARQFVEGLRARHPDATHCCFAWRVGVPAAERAADAGEPAGTAGAPMLDALRGADLTDVVAVVARWFGGTKLGKGGLARAYRGALQLALDGLPVRLERERVRLVVVFPFAKSGAVRRLLHPPEIELIGERWGETAEVELAVAVERRAALDEALAELGLAARER